MSNTETNVPADSNQKKISDFIRSIGRQAAIFICVWYATVESHYIANDLIYYYSWMIGFVAVLYSIIIVAPLHTLEPAKDRLLSLLSPSNTVTRYMGLFVSLIEISLFMRYELFVFAGFWILGEVLSISLAYKIKKLKTFLELTESYNITLVSPDGVKMYISTTDDEITKSIKKVHNMIKSLDIQIKSNEYTDEHLVELQEAREESYDGLIKILKIAAEADLVEIEHESA